MSIRPRAVACLSLFLPFVLPMPIAAQDVVQLEQTESEPLAPPPQALQTGDEETWLYEGSDIPVDREWLFGEMDNGLRYAVRHNGVPPGQVAIRIRIDAGSLHERNKERGFAHFLEHLLFRESKYLGPGEAIPMWQRLGATFGSDTNAETSFTHTVYKLDLPNASPEKVAESFKLLSGMVREPKLTQSNLAAELPIVLAEKRERGGAGERAAEQTRTTLFAGQRLAERLPIGTPETLSGATPETLQEFHRRWYRPENTVISVAGDIDPMLFAGLIEKWFGDWQAEGKHVEAPDFGDPVAPKGAKSSNPVGETAVIVEPDLPRSFTYGVMRPWRPVVDTIEYNEGLLVDAIAQALINRRLEARARAGGEYLYAQVQQDDISRSADATFVSFAPLGGDWQGALDDVRGVIADALKTPPSDEEIAREIAEFDVVFQSSVEQASVQSGAELADNIVEAVDIRETTASPETVLQVFRGMTEKITPARVLEHTRALFDGTVIRGAYLTPDASEAKPATVRTALLKKVTADENARLAASTISFADLPPIGEPGEVVARQPTGLFGIEQIQFANGVKALLWAHGSEPGRVSVNVRFGSGFQAFDAADGPYINLAQGALVGSGIGELGQEEIDRITTGRKMGFDFEVDEGAFVFSAQTRKEDLADQLYLFAAKLDMPRWDPNPVQRNIAAARIAYESYETNPGGVLSRDLEYLLRDKDTRFATPTPQTLAGLTPEGFRETWEPVLAEGPVEVIIFGDFDADAAVADLSRTFGALEPREVDADLEASEIAFPAAQEAPTVLTHRGDPDQAAAVVAWPSGGGVDDLRLSRQLEILTQLFNNRLLEAMRERSGASYAPNVSSNWPTDVDSGGRITAFAQLKPEDVPIFFEEADRIAAELASTPVEADELARVTEPLRQLINRASTANQFWLYQLEGATRDPRLIGLTRSLMADYSRTTPEAMQALAARFLDPAKEYKIAVIPEGQQLSTRRPEVQTGR
ncbi:M16 family metallopeptidase [Qipengyuania atrilutea]|uniref:Insulinase family protein n=1 Tax=Qipengyuania atrilutea TaxID=2744473 RepID=A0A850H0K5_9SPHN|nr:M16 family metallopeptidase [Actirhodobacter atriluteus]NVD44167.1 insulinase family protein [Actirhodobacter atriluteus]